MRLTARQLRQIIKEELTRLNETRPRHGLDPREFGRKVVYLRDGREGVVVSASRDQIQLQTGEIIIPSQVDWPRTTGSKR